MEVNDIHVGRQLQVTSGIGAGVAGPAVTPSPPALAFGAGPTAISGTAWIENGLLVGNPNTYPSPIIEAQLMVGRAPQQNLRATALSIFKVSSRGSISPTGTPIDVMLGDPSGPVGVQIYGGALNPVVVQAKDFLFTALTSENHATLKKTNLTTSKDDINGVKNDVGSKANTGIAGNTGVQIDNSATSHSGPELNLATPAVGAADYTSVAASLNGTQALASAAMSLAGKGFDIPHPTKKEHRLRYICLEGPEVGAYFRGTLKDNDTIELPEYWRELVYPETITVNLTPVGSYQELFIEKIEWGTKIKIKNNSGTSIHCHYTVFAERVTQDKLQVEYKGLTPDDYPGDNTEYALGGWDYARHKGEPKSSNL